MQAIASMEFLETPIRDFIVPSEKVAHVQLGNSAEHAILVLTKTGYTAIPVLDHRYHIRGLLNTPRITESILGMEHIEYERLSSIRVDDIMQTDLPLIHIGGSFGKAFNLLINHPFLCVVDEDGLFLGILTRRVLLKQLKKFLYTHMQT